MLIISFNILIFEVKTFFGGGGKKSKINQMIC